MPIFSCQMLLSILFAFCFFSPAWANHKFDPLLHRRHTSNASLPKREAASFRRGPSLEKRFDNARFTFYDVGLGACGKTNVPSDFVVALNSAQYGTGQDCFQMISINYGGKSTQAQIVDECPGCPYGGLDFSTSLFQFFASEDVGVLYGSWDFDSGDSGDSSSTSETPASTYDPPSSTLPPPSTSSSHTRAPASASTSSSSFFSSSSSLASTTTTSSTLSSASSAGPSTPSSIISSGSLGMFEETVMQLAMIVAGGAGAPPKSSI